MAAIFFSRFYVTKPLKSFISRDWTGLLIQRIDPDHFILWHPSMIAGAESTIAGAELSIGGGGGGGEGHPKSIQINTNVAKTRLETPNKYRYVFAFFEIADKLLGRNASNCY